MELDKKLMHDVQMLVSRLVEKAPQLIDNFIANLAEAWMHIRCKFDRGKVIHQPQPKWILATSMHRNRATVQSWKDMGTTGLGRNDQSPRKSSSHELITHIRQRRHMSTMMRTHDQK